MIGPWRQTYNSSLAAKRSITGLRSERQIVQRQTYREWHQASVVVAGSRFVVATKPGVFRDGELDKGAVLLAENAEVSTGDVAVHMGCGNGLAAAVSAEKGASRVVMSDRNVVSVEASRRTLTANGIQNAEIHEAHGSHGMPGDLVADLVAIRIRPEKLPLVQQIVDAFRLLRRDGRCYVAGATNEGIKPAARLLEQVFGSSSVLAYDSGHRVLVAHKKSETPGELAGIDTDFVDPDHFREIDTILGGNRLTLYSRPGVFSWEHVDEATEILAGTMAIPHGASVLDLGCGSGGLGITASLLSGGAVTMLDSDTEAVRSARKSAVAAGIVNYRVLPSDVAGAVLDERYDVVLTNPPFHIGKQTELAVPMQFIEDAWEVLVPGGRVFLVANRTLPYEMPIRQRFGNVTIAHDGRRFKVLSAMKTAG
jgi:16S rRNA (guanine1207-N2)-methyltransferase